MADDYGKCRTAAGKKKKPKKKVVGLIAKAKRRKQVSESRLAQRTGVSAKDRKRLKQLREFLKGMKGTGGKTLSDTDKTYNRKLALLEKQHLRELEKIHLQNKLQDERESKRIELEKMLRAKTKKKGGKLKNGGKV